MTSVGSFLPASSLSELHLGVVALGAFDFGALFPFGARRQRVERKRDLFQLALDVAVEAGQHGLKQPVDLRCDFVRVLLREFGFVVFYAALGIGIGAAADRDECHRAGIFFLDLCRGVTGPVAADFEVGQHHAMARVADVHGQNFAVGRSDLQHGQLMVDRSALRAAIDREI